MDVDKLAQHKVLAGELGARREEGVGCDTELGHVPLDRHAVPLKMAAQGLGDLQHDIQHEMSDNDPPGRRAAKTHPRLAVLLDAANLHCSISVFLVCAHVHNMVLGNLRGGVQ